MKNRVIIACRTLEREIQAAMKETGNSCLVYYLPLKYHVAPKEMAVELQRIIDSLSNVDEVLVCVSGCGGSTKDLKATTADIIIPKTRDCIDILLSDQEGKIGRDKNGIFFKINPLIIYQERDKDGNIVENGITNNHVVEALKELYVALGGSADSFTATTNADAIALIATVASTAVAPELPKVAAKDNGKVLKVVEGKWALGTDNVE